jgi:hypothetical protein
VVIRGEEERLCERTRERWREWAGDGGREGGREEEEEEEEELYLQLETRKRVQTNGREGQTRKRCRVEEEIFDKRETGRARINNIYIERATIALSRTGCPYTHAGLPLHL